MEAFEVAKMSNMPNHAAMKKMARERPDTKLSHWLFDHRLPNNTPAKIDYDDTTSATNRMTPTFINKVAFSAPPCFWPEKYVCHWKRARTYSREMMMKTCYKAWRGSQRVCCTQRNVTEIPVLNAVQCDLSRRYRNHKVSSGTRNNAYCEPKAAQST